MDNDGPSLRSKSHPRALGPSFRGLPGARDLFSAQLLPSTPLSTPRQIVQATKSGRQKICVHTTPIDLRIL